MIYCNVICTGLPLRLFSTLVFSGSVMLFSVVLELCALCLTVRSFIIVREDSLGPI